MSILVNKVGCNFDNDGVGTQKGGKPRGPIVSVDINDSFCVNIILSVR